MQKKKKKNHKQNENKTIIPPVIISFSWQFVRVFSLEPWGPEWANCLKLPSQECDIAPPEIIGGNWKHGLSINCLFILITAMIGNILKRNAPPDMAL